MEYKNILITYYYEV